MNTDNQKHIWDLGTKINVKVNPAFLSEINHTIKAKFITKRAIHRKLAERFSIPFSVFKNRIKPKYKYFVDLEIFMNLCTLLRIPLEKFEQNIIAYKTRKGSNCIKNPKLPITITPIFDMLIAHLIGDGFVINPKRGRKPYFGYRQYNTEYRNLFLRKIESVFGNISYKDDYILNEKTTQIYFPVVCSEIVFKKYNLNDRSFLSEKARIPPEILDKSWQHKLAFLIGIIIDEGHVDSDLIVINMKNKAIVEDLQKICTDLGYQTTLKTDGSGFSRLYLLSKSLPPFYGDYISLLSEYPEVNLGYKEQKIRDFIFRLNKPKRYVKGNKQKILTELLKNNLTIDELASRLNMTRQGARFLIISLVDENKVEIKSRAKFGSYKYGLR